MRLEQTPRPNQTLRVSARLITSSTILHLSSDELERAVNQEQMENPALDVKEQRICLFCGTHLYGDTCSACGHLAQATSQAQDSTQSYAEPQSFYQQSAFYDIDNYGFAEVDGDDAYDPLAHIANGDTLAEALLQQLEAMVALDDALIAEQLVGNLNERGYLEISSEEIATLLHVSVERVEYVLGQLHTLEPLGIGARNLRECLLIQLAALTEQNLAPHPLAHAIIDGYLDQL
jgi:RNA polymerase sigma-54 factor